MNIMRDKLKIKFKSSRNGLSKIKSLLNKSAKKS